MTYLYQLIILGSPSLEQAAELKHCIQATVQEFGLQLEKEIAWVVNPADLKLYPQQSTAALFFCGENAPQAHLLTLLKRNIPIIPIVSDLARAKDEIPELLRSLNCVSYQEGLQRVATALLECAGLLPRQRRVFISYRREEARHAALQLFDELSARLFDVFLDTHDIHPAEDFQAMLWHRLCDSDVVIMLYTPSYFESRWTQAEFGRALAKGILILRITWPEVEPSKLTSTTTPINLSAEDINQETGYFTEKTIDQICLQLEMLRSKSHAVRNVNFVSNLRAQIEAIGGSVVGIGANNSLNIRLANGKDVVVFSAVGAPTSMTLHEAVKNASDRSTAVVFDARGLHQNWLEHLDWLGSKIDTPRWVKAHEAGWQFADWEV